jgi:2-polyprenyl-3-methyl-5-hydroxy-6-metoxy-1,4-benzoquinol methylase
VNPAQTTPSRQLYEEYWSRASPSPLADPRTPLRRALLWQLLGQHGVSPIRLLDCGAGDGGLVAEAVTRGLDATGIEIAEAAIAQGRASHPEVELIQHSVEDRPWPVPSQSFDCVVAFEVIEHLLRPTELLAGAHAALVPDGHLAISTPYHGFVKNVAVAAFRFESHFDVVGEHVRFITDRAMRDLLEANGFDVLEVIHLGRFRPLWANTFVWAKKA